MVEFTATAMAILNLYQFADRANNSHFKLVYLNAVAMVRCLAQYAGDVVKPDTGVT